VKVLIAEDEPLFRKILSQLLSPEFELTVTEDGTTALAGLQEEDGPVLAILDWVVPGLTGIDGCRELRTRRQTAGIYIYRFQIGRSRRAMTMRGSKPHSRSVACVMPCVYRLKYEEIETRFLLG
jgi:CheY-like chemotaxis protein